MNRSPDPMITTIIPTYRRPKLLRRAILSVLSQTYPNLQVCVYDNASNDETASVVAELAKKDPRVKYYCHKKNIGGLPNFQYGLEQVNTPFFSFLSDDDVILPEFYQVAMEEFSRFPEAMCSAGSTIVMSDKGEVNDVPLEAWEREGIYSPPEGLFRTMGGKHPPWTGVLFRREVVDKVGLLDLEVSQLTDIDFQLRLAARFHFVISKKPCAIFVNHGGSSCMTADSSFLWPGWLKFARNITDDDRIPKDTRARASVLLAEDLKSLLFGIWIQDMSRKDFVDSYKVAGLLKERCGQNAMAGAVYATTKLYEHIPPLYYVLNGLVQMRKFLRRSRSPPLQEKYGKYAKFLEM
jgi:glycosyltransferase involved in cell wall biosynthesis